MNLTELLDKTARSLPHKPAIIEGATTVSYAGLVEKIADFAAQLEKFQLASCGLPGRTYAFPTASITSR